MHQLALIACLLLAQPDPVVAEQADPPADIEVRVPTKPGKMGRYLTLHALTKGEFVIWLPLDQGVDFLDPELAPKDSKISAVIADAPGKYRMLAITAIANKPAYCEFTVEFIGKVPPPPPPPPPGPTPPSPTDPLFLKIQSSYMADAAAPLVRDRQKSALEGLYLAMVDHARDPAIKTTGDLLGDLKKISGQLLVPNVLMDLRKVIATEIVAALGADDGTVALDPALRPKAVDVFARIAAALHGVK